MPVDPATLYGAATLGSMIVGAWGASQGANAQKDAAKKAGKSSERSAAANIEFQKWLFGEQQKIAKPYQDLASDAMGQLYKPGVNTYQSQNDIASGLPLTRGDTPGFQAATAPTPATMPTGRTQQNLFRGAPTTSRFEEGGLRNKFLAGARETAAPTKPTAASPALTQDQQKKLELRNLYDKAQEAGTGSPEETAYFKAAKDSNFGKNTLKDIRSRSVEDWTGIFDRENTATAAAQQATQAAQQADTARTASFNPQRFQNRILEAERFGQVDPFTYNALADPERIRQAQQIQGAEVGFDPMTGAGGATYEAFDPSTIDITQDPSYQFRLSEGQKAVERSAAARGGVMSGAQQKAMQDYSQNVASTEYGNVFNRAFATHEAGQRGGLQANLQNFGQTATQTEMNNAARLAAERFKFGTSAEAAQANNAANFRVQQANIANALGYQGQQYQQGLGAYQTNLGNQLDIYGTNLGTDIANLNAFNQAQGQQYNMLASQMGMGQTATGQVMGAGANLGSQVGGAYNTAGSTAAQAALSQGQAQAGLYGNLANVANTGMQNYLMYNMYNQGQTGQGA